MIKTLMVTWNSEYRSPSQGMINALMSKINMEEPDVIFITQQEAPINVLTKEGDNIAAMLSNAANGSYTLRGSKKIIGSTKPPAVCATRAAVLTRTSKNARFGDPVLGSTGVEGQVLEGGVAGALRGQGSVKGGCYCTIVYRDQNDNVQGVKNIAGQRNLAFVGAHLDAGNAGKRAAQIKGVLAKISGLTLNDAIGAPPTAAADYQAGTINTELRRGFDAVFFMGDLNYRLRGTADLIVNNTALKNGSTAMTDVVSTEDMAVLIRDNFDKLIMLDELLTSPLVAEYRFQFAVPKLTGNTYLPTYKLNYKDADGGQEAMTRYKNAKTAADVKATLMKLYKMAPLWNQKRGCFDLGFLDRIGYIAQVSNVPNGTQAVTVDECKVIDQVISDHLPVYTRATVF